MIDRKEDKETAKRRREDRICPMCEFISIPVSSCCTFEFIVCKLIHL